jgi:glycosyltransferase involved in cell wall biosynthesis
MATATRRFLMPQTNTLESSKRIAILGSRGIPARYGGFETFAEQLAIRLVKRGHQVTVFCESGGDRTEEYQGICLQHVRTRSLGGLRTLVYDAKCLWRARKGFDVVYMLGYGSSALCCVPRFWGSQVWINMDGLEWTRAKWKPAARWYLRSAEAIAMWTPNRIIADAAGIKSNLESRHSHLPPCDVIPYGGEVVTQACFAELQSLGLSPRSYYLVVCRFEPENNVHEIIRGFSASCSDAKLVLVGDSSLSTDYVKSIVEHRSDRIVFTGPIYDAERIRALRFFCRGYLHGHSVGGTNPSLLEAMGCGNLVIAHDNVFNREVLGPAGLFFTNTDSIVGCIDAVDSQKPELGWMRAEVVNRVREFYTWDSIANHYCELISLACSASKDRAAVIHRAPFCTTRSVPFDSAD